MFFIKTFDSKISWNINKIYFKTFSHPFQIGFISNVIQTISYQISIQTLSYQIQNQIHFKYIFLWSSNIKWCPVTFISNPKSNTFQIYFSLVIKYQMVPSYFHIKSKIKYISNIFFSGHQISNGAQLLSYQIQNQYISNIFFSGHQISNGAQLCGTFKWVASRKLFLLRWTEPNTTSTSNL